jgi:carbon monoxide dehydrogenase subunit G
VAACPDYDRGVRFEKTIEVARPPDEAFAYVADFSNLAAWDPGVVEARKLENALVGVGSEFDVVAVFRGRRMPFRFRIVALDPGRKVVAEAESEKARSTDTATFSAAGEATRITYRSDWRLKGIRRLAEPLLAPLVAASGRRALRGLREALSSGSA